MLGHKSATMTLDLYGHLFADQLDEVADALDAAASAARVAPLLPHPRIVILTRSAGTLQPPESGGCRAVAPSGFEPPLPP